MKFRSISSDSITSTSPPGEYETCMIPPRSRSTSPIKIKVVEKIRSLTPEKSNFEKNHTTDLSVRSEIQGSGTEFEGTVSSSIEHHGTYNSHKNLPFKRSKDKLVSEQEKSLK